MGAAAAQTTPAESDTSGARYLGVLTGLTPANPAPAVQGAGYRFGIYTQKSYSADFFGEARLSIGDSRYDGRRFRLIPAEYRLNFRPVIRLFDAMSRRGAISPYFYMGGGMLYHKPIEDDPVPDPRTRRLNERLPASSLYSFESGLTPLFSFGGGVDIRLAPRMSLGVQVGSVRLLNQIALSGERFRDSYLDVSVGLQIRMDRCARPGKETLPPVAKPAKEEGPPPPGAERRELAADTAVAEQPLDTVKTELAGVTADTLSLADCLFSVQVGGYSTPANAIRAIDSTGVGTVDEYGMYHDTGRDLYVVRSRPDSSLSGATDRLRALKSQDEESAAEPVLVRRCGEVPGLQPLRYQIQFAALSDSLNAVGYAEKLAERHGIETAAERGDGGLYKVRTRAYPSLTGARAALRELRKEGAGEGLFLAVADTETGYAPSYDYMLQAGDYSSSGEFVERLDQFREATGMEGELLLTRRAGGDDRYVLVVRPASWQELLAMRQKMEDSGWTPSPVIHLIEKTDE